MCTSEEISLKDFASEVSNASDFVVDVDALLQVCGASPVHVHYKTDKIIVVTTYPETILLKSGNSYINLSQIMKITRQSTKGRCTYEVHCGLLDELKTTVKITNS